MLNEQGTLHVAPRNREEDAQVISMKYGINESSSTPSNYSM